MLSNAEWSELYSRKGVEWCSVWIWNDVVERWTCLELEILALNIERCPATSDDCPFRVWTSEFDLPVDHRVVAGWPEPMKVSAPLRTGIKWRLPVNPRLPSKLYAGFRWSSIESSRILLRSMFPIFTGKRLIFSRKADFGLSNWSPQFVRRGHSQTVISNFPDDLWSDTLCRQTVTRNVV